MLIHTVLALSSFFSNNFPHVSWYPYWYLGNPYHYLIGPVVPIALAIVQSSKFKVQSYDLYLGFILLSFVVGGIGIYFLLRDWRVGKLQAIASGVLYTVLPAGFFLLNFQNGLNHIGFGFLPFVLLIFRRFLLKESSLWTFWLVVSITTIFLTSISVLLPLVIGFIALVVSGKDRHSGEEERRLKRFWTSQNDGIEDKIAKTILIIFLALLLSTLWYTPRFWWVIATNPSLGGVPLGKLAWSILQFLLQFLPLVLVIVVVKFRKYKFQGHLLFGFLFFASFLFLSLVRFVSDPDFVMDWIAFGLELQMGGAIILGNLIQNSKFKIQNYSSKFKILKTFNFKLQLLTFNFALLTCLLVLSIIFDFWILRLMISQSKNDYQSRIISILKTHVKETERIFLSGSSVFFINSRLDIQQVRGGVDQSSIHPFWLHGAYQIREGRNGDLAYDWLTALGIYYVLVHDKGSKEPFKDFKYPDKFSQLCHSGAKRSEAIESLGDPIGRPAERDSLQDDRKCIGPLYFELVNESSGDTLYKVKDASIGRMVDASILSVQKPKDGADEHAINNYILSFKRPLAVNYQKPNEIAISGNIKQGEIISLAISYDPYWRIEIGEGIIDTDSLGNMVIIPKNTGSQRFTIVYKRSILDLAIPLGLSIAIVIILIKYQKIAPYVRKRFPKLHVGLGEEKEY